MPDLSSHVNVFETCLRILEGEGWRVRMSYGTVEDELPTWSAERDGVELWADNPIELLGLVAVHRARWPGAYEPWWWTRGNEPPSVYDRLQDEALADEERRIDAFEELRATEPEAWEAKVREAIAETGDLTNGAYTLRIPRTTLKAALEDPRLADLRDTPYGP